MMRRLADDRAGSRGCGGAGNESVLISVASGDSPVPRDASAQSEFETISALTAGLHDPGGIVGIGRPSICTVQPKDCGRQREESVQIPLDAGFIVAELFRFDLLGDRSQRRELISGAWQKRNAVIAIDRELGHRLENNSGAR